MLIEQEPIIRLSFFFSGLILFWLLGVCFPYRPFNLKQRSQSWRNNLLIIVVNSVLLRFLAPISLTILALECTKNSWGLLNLLQISNAAAFVIAIILLDLGIYWQHRLVHKIPLLWRIHRLHHSDMEIDVTTAGRFHVLEILLSFALKALMIFIVGAPAAAVIVFEVLLNFSAMFNHANIHLPRSIEPIVRLFIVTPSMHRVHHSVKPAETDSNYGFCLSIWDRIFGSYLERPEQNPKEMIIGLNQFRSNDEQKITALLLQPFKD